ncbi:hypothetical protein [Actinoplanes philippinensis]|uniref:hypothetical protein n=1 Tax=Actinoplanes philippinensis TaxID=35752 RepID=UPI0033E7F65E
MDASRADDLPHDVRLLRALIASGEHDLGPALQRYSRLPGYSPSLADIVPVPAADPSPLMEAPLSPQPTESLVHLGTHIVQTARYIDTFFGFDQWFLFDSRWAAAHSDLARSLLRYAAHWDPFA